ncbi:MAG TPA: prepilin-type N-terminal cleavage/methylation domain-containing protein [Candidatus Paceibacterota bacterium]|nr:prepilin-type N-terminal cleavage/methylation domain-containing protein [Candidatus Paceibacterota bacterium]
MKKRSALSGFTLVEAMVAISILSLAVTGPLVIAQKGISSAIYARDQITAYYLAQEAVEYVRNARDTNRIQGNPWLASLAACKQGASGGEACQIDARYTDFTSTGAVSACPGSGCPAISVDSSSGQYGYASGGAWKQTAFTRTVSIDDRASAKEAVISVTVSWRTNLFLPLRTFTIKEYVFDF